MKKSAYIFLLTIMMFTVASCIQNNNKQALLYLKDIDSLSNQGNYEEVLQKTDSIQVLFPEVFNEMKEGLAFKQEQIKKLSDGILHQPGSGEQCGINSIIKQKDYTLTVFDYYLSPSPDYPENSFSNVELEKIYNNPALKMLFDDSVDISSIYTPIPENQDTIKLIDDFHMNLSHLLVKLEPFDKKSEEHYILSIALNGEFREESWYSNKVIWKGTTDFIPIKNSSQYYYRIPDLYEDISESELTRLKTTLNLRDTLVESQMEIGGTATIVYKEKPCFYINPSCIFRIEKYIGQELKYTNYIRIEFTLGC